MDRSVNVKVYEFYKEVPQVLISLPNLISAALKPVGIYLNSIMETPCLLLTLKK